MISTQYYFTQDGELEHRDLMTYTPEDAALRWAAWRMKRHPSEMTKQELHEELTKPGVYCERVAIYLADEAPCCQH